MNKPMTKADVAAMREAAAKTYVSPTVLASNPHPIRGDVHAPLYRYPRTRIEQVRRVAELLAKHEHDGRCPGTSNPEHAAVFGRWQKGDNGRYGGPVRMSVAQASRPSSNSR